MNFFAQLVFDWAAAWPAAIGAGVLALLAIYRFYARGIGRPWRMVLPALRGVALVALAVSLIQPVVVAPAAEERGAILLLVDRSAAMGVISGQSPDALVGLADGLGMLAPGRRDLALQSLHANVLQLRSLLDDLLRARSELDYARASSRGEAAARDRLDNASEEFRSALREIADHPIPSTRPAKPAEPLAVLLRLRANSERLTGGSQAITALLRWTQEEQAYSDRQLYRDDPDVRAACDRLGALSPWGRVELAMVTSGTGVLARMGNGAALFGYTVGDDARALPLARDGEPVRKLLASPGDSVSDLSTGIESAIAENSGRAIDGIIVFSDGRPIGRNPGLGPAVAQTGAPVFLVCASEPQLSSGEPIRELAQSSGGAVLTLDQIATLPELLSRARTSQAKQARVELWDSPYLYALVLGALTAEWAIRKRLGLP